MHFMKKRKFKILLQAKKKSIVHKSLMDWKICDQINFIQGINHLKIEWKVNFLPKYGQL